MKTVKLAFAAACLCTGAITTPLAAQSSSYTPGTVWQVSSIKVEPGQFETYMDYLSGNWRKQQEFLKKDGYVVSYHVFSVNNARDGEPDLMLAIEYKDYTPNAAQLDIQKKFETMMAMDTHKIDAASGARAPMRKLAGSVELQELKFK